MVADRLAEPGAVRAAALLALGVAALAGLVLALTHARRRLLVVGAVAIAAAWTYTAVRSGSPPRAPPSRVRLLRTGGGGRHEPRPSRPSSGCGRRSSVGWRSGAQACAILVANNLRDVPTRAPGRRQTDARSRARRSTGPGGLDFRAAPAGGRRDRRPRDADDRVGVARSRWAGPPHRPGADRALRCLWAGVVPVLRRRGWSSWPSRRWSRGWGRFVLRGAEVADRCNLMSARAGPQRLRALQPGRVVVTPGPVQLRVAEQLGDLVCDRLGCVALRAASRPRAVLGQVVVVGLGVEFDHTFPGDTANSEHKIVFFDLARPLLLRWSGSDRAVTISACRRSRLMDRLPRADRTRIGVTDETGADFEFNQEDEARFGRQGATMTYELSAYRARQAACRARSALNS